MGASEARLARSQFFVNERIQPPRHKEHQVLTKFLLDHLAYSVIHTAQLISYLRASHCKLGLLINFNVPLLKQGIRRVIY